MADIGYSWCPGCKKWIPEQHMLYDSETSTRVCAFCLDGTSDTTKYTLDEHHEDTKCVYCGSYNTTEQAPKWLWFRCNNCNNTFRRF